jgi:hypothetical protein
MEAVMSVKAEDVSAVLDMINRGDYVKFEMCFRDGKPVEISVVPLRTHGTVEARASQSLESPKE